MYIWLKLIAPDSQLTFILFKTDYIIHTKFVHIAIIMNLFICKKGFYYGTILYVKFSTLECFSFQGLAFLSALTWRCIAAHGIFSLVPVNMIWSSCDIKLIVLTSKVLMDPSDSFISIRIDGSNTRCNEL